MTVTAPFAPHHHSVGRKKKTNIRRSCMALRRTTVEELATKAARTVGARLAEHVARTPDKVLLSMPGVEYTYASFHAETNRMARGFQRLGVKKGDTVCQMLPNCPAFLLNWIALAKFGAIEVGVNTEFSGDALVRLLNVSEARILVLDAQFDAAIAKVAAELVHLEHIIIQGPSEYRAHEGLSHFTISRLEDLPDASAEDVAADVSRIDTLMLVFTSGTTGVSKAVEISHSYALHFAAEMIDNWGLGEDDVLYSPYPLFHTEASVLTFLTALHCGARAAIAPKFSASRFWDEIRHYGVTFTTFMGAVTTILYKRPPEPNDADNPLRLVSSCPTPPFWREFEKRFNLKIVETYGATECCQPSWDPLDVPHRDGACGKITDRYEVRIADDFDEAVPTGTIGEILIRPKEPYTMMTRYFRNPEATAEVFKNLWYHTGDLGHRDGDGYLYFIGRKKDSIRRRGKNISAFEVEEILNKHPAILESAVIGVPSEFTEDEVKAVIVLRPDRSADPVEIIAWAMDNMPKYYVPRYVEITVELPKSSTGKVQKVELRERWRNASTFDGEAGTIINNVEAR
ncbi:AMP-binding protein [Chelatococcus sp. GCM10030263]|uniref:AMP-binding protein n=1 Tax=Chelatococcus sp. GCM10030263 TaxID=3273387 RepID=UPI0036130F33